LETRVVAADAAGLEAAAALLRAGRLVAFPTETVYGLGANALDAEAVAGIFRAKGRPADDPLIVHLAGSEDLPRVARTIPPLAWRLAQAFWPGPLSLVLRKATEVPLNVTAGLDTVAVRLPAHPVAQALIRAAGVPVAAPSANLFSRPSPTRAEHVLEDLGSRIDLVLDGGPAEVGLESTIVDLSGSEPRLLRPGGLSAEAIEAVIGQALLPPPDRGQQARPQPAPGLLDLHYAPRTPLTLIVGPPPAARPKLAAELRVALARGDRVGLLALEEDRDWLPTGAVVEVVGSWGDPDRTARRLFETLRGLDRRGLDLLLARELADPASGLGRALADRLRRAARRIVQA
jgi:L-threonylcarbamoyladenylate synthase